MSNDRVKLTIINNTGTVVKCTDVACETFTNLEAGSTVTNNGKSIFTSETNDRLFCTFEQEAPGKGVWQLAMTCPKSSHNSACGSLNAGLQAYAKTGTPAEFTFNLGEANQADWDHGDSNEGDTIPYGACS